MRNCHYCKKELPEYQIKKGSLYCSLECYTKDIFKNSSDENVMANFSEWFVEPGDLVSNSIKCDHLEGLFSYVYFLIDNSEIVYVGQALNLQNRLEMHKLDKTFSRVSWLLVPRNMINTIEAYYINELKPKYNKAYPKQKARLTQAVRPLRAKLSHP